MSNKITFKIVLASDPNCAYKTISILSEAPFTAVLRYAAEQFGENPSTCGITTSGGVGINPDQTCGNIFLKHGGELKLIPKDKVGGSEWLRATRRN